MNLDLKKAYEESIRLRWTEKVDRKGGQKTRNAILDMIMGNIIIKTIIN